MNASHRSLFVAALVVTTSAVFAAPFQSPVAITNGQTYNSPTYDLRTIWNSQGKPDGLYFAVGAPMNSSGTATITVIIGSNQYTRTATRYQGAAFAFTGVKNNANNVMVADLRGFQSSGWQFATSNGNSLTAATMAGSSAAGSAVIRQDTPISNIRVRITMVVDSGPVGASATYLGDSWNTTSSTTPPKPRGNVNPNKDYQRYPYGVRIEWTGRNSFAYRGSWSFNNNNFPQVFRNPDSGKWTAARDQTGTYAVSPQAGYYKTWALVEGLNSNGNWANIGKCDTDYYVPVQLANTFDTLDDASLAIEGITRTRRDVIAGYRVGIGGITVGSSDPGEQSFAVLVKPNNYAAEIEMNYAGQVVSGNTSTWWSSTVAGWSNGIYCGWPLNNVYTLQVDPRTTASGILAGSTLITARTALKQIRTNGSYWNVLNPSTAYEMGSRANLYVVPEASGTATWSDGEAIAFTTGTNRVKGQTITDSNATVNVALTNQYPYSYVLAVVRSPDGQYKAVNGNHPAGGTTASIALSSALGDSGDYNLYLLNYTPVDQTNIGNAVVYGRDYDVDAGETEYVTLPGLETGGNSLPFGYAQAEELTSWRPPGRSQEFTYGWKQLARMQFRYEGQINVNAMTIQGK